MFKQALAAALSIGLAASGITAAAHEGTVACGDEKKTETPKPKPQPKPSFEVACGDEKKTETPKPKPQPKPSVWAIG